MKTDFSIALLLILAFISVSLASPLPEAVPGEFIVKYRDNKKLNFKSIPGIKSHEIIKTKWANLAVIKVSDNKSVLSLKDDPNIEYIEPNYIWRINTEVPNDPKFSKLWGLHNTKRKGVDINALKAWEFTKKYGANKEVVIAVIDTGVNHKHEDLQGNMWTNQAELNGQPGIDDDGNGYIDRNEKVWT